MAGLLFRYIPNEANGVAVAVSIVVVTIENAAVGTHDECESVFVYGGRPIVTEDAHTDDIGIKAVACSGKEDTIFNP